MWDKMKTEYRTIKLKCKKCGKEYTVETDIEYKDPGCCSGCKK